ncbi:MAG TPA: peptidylprolyl isomerase [Amycolatopsis sp.]|uniref:peptidylprolyl isomerase n=1 Tax=unclassified Amycolatopsis TaxID=2618356 RepID=UPI001F0CEE06|nr:MULTISPECIES: peptidylprolyl isomerase [unclassified Amycolatopsis]HWD05772.1 peptidylprolyl isomerase [Amycolatopsis sp.]
MPADDETEETARSGVATVVAEDDDVEAVEEESGLPRGGEDAEPSRQSWIRSVLSRVRRAVRLPRTRKGRIVAVLVLAVLVGGGTGGYFWWDAGRLPAGAAFRVGGTVVTVDQLNAEADRLRALYGLQVPTDPAKLDGFRRAVAKADAVRIILDGQARQHGIVVADKTAQDVLTRYVSQQSGDGADAKANFVQGLGAAGTSEQAVLDEIKHMLAVNQLFGQQTHGVAVSDQQVRDAFPKRQASLGTPEKREIRNIVVRTQDEAKQLLGQVSSGAVFEGLAKKSSLDDQTRASGGDLGALTADQLDPAYAKAAFATPSGAVFGPVQTSHGWNVGKVVSVVPAVPAQFDAVKDKLKLQLTNEQLMSRWQDWLTQQIRSAAVQYADDYRPADPDAPPPTGLDGQPAAPVPAPAGK